MSHPTASSARATLALIGSGPTALYILRHLLDRADTLQKHLKQVLIFERGDTAGVGMPYSADHTDLHNLCNISSEEIPKLDQTLADWMHDQDAATLQRYGCDHEQISETETYSRLALGNYFSDQFKVTLDDLRDAGFDVQVKTRHAVADLIDLPGQGLVKIVAEGGREFKVGRVVIATGHTWPDKDEPDAGYFASPWPIRKLLPDEGQHFNFTIGTLGASLSAFDVVASLAHRHGSFTDQPNGRLTYTPDPDTDDSKLVMHAAHGWLPHLQYEQEEAFREVYRHVDRDTLMSLLDGRGFLRLDTYFDHVCRPALATAMEKDERPDLATPLRDGEMSLSEFVEKLTDEHEYADPFRGMRQEMPEAEESLRYDLPIHWKEVFDDLMYTLNYHAELLPAEDHLRWRSDVMPFLLNVIAAMPLQSARTWLALEAVGKLELVPGYVSVKSKSDGITRVSVENDGQTREIDYRMFIDCTGQPAVEVGDYPFPTLVEHGTVRAARVAFADPAAASDLPEEKRQDVITPPNAASASPAFPIGGIDITRHYHVIGEDAAPNPRIQDAAFPHTLGLRPYSYGLQACEHTAALVVEAWQQVAAVRSQTI